jgi:predicted lysophospholipase L1 biosynthesis ABC-type transport system permease subunit
MNAKGILATLAGFALGGFLILPLMFLSHLLPDKIKEHDLFPIFVGILAGSAGMYLVVTGLAGNGWEDCLPFCNK